MINKRKIIRWLRSLRHDLSVKSKFFLSLPTTFTMPWLKEKPFFHFGITFNTPLLQKKKFDFYWTTTLLCYDYENNVFALFHWDIHDGNIFLHYLKSLITSLTCQKKSQMVSSSKKNMFNFKNFLPQELQWSLTRFTSPILWPWSHNSHKWVSTTFLDIKITRHNQQFKTGESNL